MDSGFVEAGSCDIYYESHGSGPAILFIHAGVADSRMWRAQLHLDRYRAIVFDKRGHGNTVWAPGDFSDTEDSLAVLDHLDVDSAMIVGCSMGGGTALDLAIDQPDRVDGLVLVGAYPSGWVPDDGWEEGPLDEEAAAAAEARDFDRMVDIDYRMWLVGYGRSESEVAPELRDLFIDMDRVPVTTAAEREIHQTGFEKRFNDHLDEIGVRTLVMVGAHDEPLLIEAAHYLASELSSRDAIVIDSAAHLPSLEQPQVFNAALLEFLRS